MNAVQVAGPAGVRISVELASQAFVYLMDSSNYQSFRHSQQGRGAGGWYVRSPVRFTKPDSNDWYVIVYDKFGGHPPYRVTTG